MKLYTNIVGDRFSIKQQIMTKIILPNTPDIEEAVLGAILVDKHAILLVESDITPDTFYSSKNRYVWEAIEELQKDGDPIDILTVTSKLKEHGTLKSVGGPFYISELTDRVGTSENIEYHAKILQQNYILREIIKRGNDYVRKASSGADPIDLLSDFESSIRGIGDSVFSGEKTRTNKEILIDIHRQIENSINSDRDILGITSGIQDLDKTLGGFIDTSLYILAARPGMGKSGLMLTIAEASEKDKKHAVILTLEMSDVEIMKRRLTRAMNTSVDEINKGRVDMVKLQEATSKLDSNYIHIWDYSKMSISDLRNKVRRAKLKGEIDFLIVDYLQLMDGDKEYKGSKHHEVGSISRGLKGIAKENGIPVLALAQLSRSVESRGGDKRPMLSDLKESGDIEQDADVVMFIYRPEYYDIPEFEDGASSHGMAEVIIAKNRHGALKRVRTGFDGPRTNFYCLDSRNFDDVRNISEHTPYKPITANESFDDLGDEVDF